MRAQLNSSPAQNPQVDHITATQGPTMKEELAAAAAKTAPPAAVAGSYAVLGLTLNEWVAIATLAYIALQAVVLVRNEFIRRREK